MLIIKNYFFLIFKDGTNAVACLNPASGNKTVQNYYNNGYSPSLLDSNNPTLGISSSSLSVSGTNLICTFNRQNSDSNAKYFNLNTNNPYLIVAYGPISSGSILFLLFKIILYDQEEIILN